MIKASVAASIAAVRDLEETEFAAKVLNFEVIGEDFVMLNKIINYQRLILAIINKNTEIKRILLENTVKCR